MKNRPDFTSYDLETFEPVEMPLPSGDFWVFGYGSLMWNPGIETSEAIPAQLYGYHRRLCLWSVQYRGSPSEPGLVLGLDHGGSCRGVAFKIPSKATKPSVQYLQDRELNTDAYHPVLKNIHLEDGRRVQALVFIAKTDHPQYTPPLSRQDIAHVVQYSHGDRGNNRDYLLNTVEHLDEFGIQRTELHHIASLIK